MKNVWHRVSCNRPLPRPCQCPTWCRAAVGYPVCTQTSSLASLLVYQEPYQKESSILLVRQWTNSISSDSQGNCWITNLIFHFCWAVSDPKRRDLGKVPRVPEEHYDL